jgi:hypothetical protein
MNKMMAENNENIFGALKLIEQLYLDGQVPGCVFRNILKEHSETVSVTDFNCYSHDKESQKEGNVCMD